jgi:YesN/AraC family two-component response regulator
MDYIARHFGRPDLTLHAMAGTLEVSPRYLQLLLEEAGTSFTNAVNKARLDQAHALLSECVHRIKPG